MARTSPLKKLNTLLKSNKDLSQKAVQLIALAPELELGDTDAIVQAMDDALPSADPLIQVAIMDTYFEMTGDPFHEGDLEDMMKLAQTMGDAGEQLYMFARIALGRINGQIMDRLDTWGDGQLEITATSRRRRRKRRRGPAKIVDEITIMIHGTWASNGKWWRPGGDFFEYVKKDLGRSDLYSKSDRFVWSGKNRDRKRKQAGVELSKWLKEHKSSEVNVFAHSHGANIAMLATHQDIRMDRLIMLSPPVRKDYFAKWSNVGQAYNIQAAFDPVVGIARGGQWFNNSHVKEKKLKFNGHSASHEPHVWRKDKLPKFVGMPWPMKND